LFLTPQTKTENTHDKLENLYQNALTRPCGHTVEYRGYTLEKVNWSHPEHDEYNIKNRDGKVVESYTITAFDSPRDLKQRLDNLINENPATIKEAVKGGSK
jgi:argonaute-like protein implicated in RNA metabolism and viral defense